MRTRIVFRTAFAALFGLLAALAPLAATTFAAAAKGQSDGLSRHAVHTRAEEISGPLHGSQVRALPFAAGHVAVYWNGSPDAIVTVALSPDGGAHFGDAAEVEPDEIGQERNDGRTYGTVMNADGATAVTLTSDRPIGKVTVVAMADEAGAGAAPAGAQAEQAPPAASAATTPPSQPAIISRADWGADETLRFDSAGNEKWVPTFWPVQKLIVHHTAGANNDPDPAATVRSIYYYHAITQGWGDIGYNFLIDESGHIYKGRDSHLPGDPTDTITGEDGSTPGNGVTAAHAVNYNSGTVGVALLGTLTNQDATPAARQALVDLLAWKAGAHNLDPNGSSNYVNPVNGGQKVFPNIAGHRDVDATECPGTTFYNTLPAVRSAVAAKLSGTPADTSPPTAPANLKATAGAARHSIALSWTASTDTGGSGVARYEIYRATRASGPFSLLATTSSTAYTNTGLSRQHTYWYYVRAVDGAGNRGPNSNTVSFTAT